MAETPTGAFDPITREQRETEHYLSLFDEITDALAPQCGNAAVNDGYRLIFALRERIRQLEAMTCPFVSAIAPCGDVHARLSERTEGESGADG